MAREPSAQALTHGGPEKVSGLTWEDPDTASSSSGRCRGQGPTQGTGVADIGRDAADDFIHKWQGVAASELSTSQSFLADLCRLLGVETPHPTPEQDYMFERPITFSNGR
jgi:hypothetical protein